MRLVRPNNLKPRKARVTCVLQGARFQRFAVILKKKISDRFQLVITHTQSKQLAKEGK